MHVAKFYGFAKVLYKLHVHTITFRESTDSDPRDTRKRGTLEWNFSLWLAVGSMYMTYQFALEGSQRAILVPISTLELETALKA